MAPSGLTLLIVSTLAFFGQAAAKCKTADDGETHGYPAELPDVSSTFLKYIVKIPTVQACQNSRPIGFSVKVCTVPASEPEPIVTVLDSQSASVEATTTTIVHVVVFCQSPQTPNSLASVVIHATDN